MNVQTPVALHATPLACRTVTAQFVHAEPHVVTDHAVSQPSARLALQSENAPVHAPKSHAPPAVHVAPDACWIVVVQFVHGEPHVDVLHARSQPSAREPLQSENAALHAA